MSSSRWPPARVREDGDCSVCVALVATRQSLRTLRRMPAHMGLVAFPGGGVGSGTVCQARSRLWTWPIPAGPCAGLSVCRRTPLFYRDGCLEGGGHIQKLNWFCIAGCGIATGITRGGVFGFLDFWISWPGIFLFFSNPF